MSARLRCRRLGHVELPALAARRRRRGACRTAQRRRHAERRRDGFCGGSRKPSRGSRALRPTFPSSSVAWPARGRAGSRRPMWRSPRGWTTFWPAPSRCRARAARSASCRGWRSACADAPDVMRGEETQLAGIFPLYSAGRHLICMPGTHSKWVEAKDGVVTGFATYLTGELFAVLSKHSILRHSLGENPPAATPDSPAFRSACDRSAGKRRRYRLQPVPHPRRDPAAGSRSPATRRQGCRAC